jgi:hypothetical protein
VKKGKDIISLPQLLVGIMRRETGRPYGTFLLIIRSIRNIIRDNGKIITDNYTIK